MQDLKIFGKVFDYWNALNTFVRPQLYTQFVLVSNSDWKNNKKAPLGNAGTMAPGKEVC